MAGVVWSASVRVIADQGDLARTRERVLARLEAARWTTSVGSGEVPGTWLLQARRGDEALSLGIAEPDESVLSRADEYALRGVGHVAPSSVPALDDLVVGLPFTDLERAGIREDLPLTAAFHARVAAWVPQASGRPRPLEGFAAVFTIHHQTDFLVLLEQALDLGLDPRMVTVIDKQYRYEHSRRVNATIKERLGVTVHRYDNLERASPTTYAG